MRRFWRNNGLSIVLLALFVVFLVGQALAGWCDHNHEQTLHGLPKQGFIDYAASGDFLESVSENWESEFLQMGMFVLLSVFLFQKGSSESKDPDEQEAVDEEPSSSDPGAPWPVRVGGIALWLYKHSLSSAFFLIFGLSFVLHAVAGLSAYNDELREHGGQELTLLGYLASGRFWFESFQNWQSEFLAISLMVVLSIFLREWGSPQSKPVAAPHSQTGA